jgi:hypothetical protein
MTHDEKVCQKLREVLDLPVPVSDEQIMAMMRGTLLMASAELNVAGREVVDAMAGPVARALERMWPKDVDRG